MQMRQRGADMPFGMVELRNIARELLPQRERRGVLQVGAADLDDATEILRLAGQCAAQGRQRRQQVLGSPTAHREAETAKAHRG